MNYPRAIVAGAITWLLIFSTFIIVYYIPALKNSLNLQALVVGLLILPFASIGTAFYLKKGNKFIIAPVALTMVFTAATLNTLITVPFIEIPFNGRGHLEFFSSPLFWILISEIIIVIYMYWRIKIRPVTT